MDVKLIYFLYRGLGLASLPFIVLYFLRRALRDARYLRGFAERLGFLPHHFKQTVSGAIWLHAVSVGEVLSSMELLRRLRAGLPSVPLFVSTATLAGRALADEKLQDLADGVFYAPFDYCFSVRRVLRTLRPAVVVVAETEIWPNLYRETKRSGASLLIVNGRISDRAMPRYARFRWFFRRVLRWPDRILAQSEVSRQRYVELGAPAERVVLGGNLKFDFVPQAGPPEPVERFLEKLRPAHLWIAASTMPPAAPGDVDEDEAVIHAFRQLAPAHPGLLLILVPRRPERFGVAAEKLAGAGVPFLRRSQLHEQARLDLPGVLLLDTIGELSGLFAAADVVFMGGTLAARGGHNVLEPAFFAKPIAIGPHMENFPEIAAEFTAAEACVRIRHADDMAVVIGQLLNDRELKMRLGESARRLANSKRGATERALREVETLYQRAVPKFRPPFPLFQIYWLLSRLWIAGSAARQRIDEARRRRLDTPVISVGNVSMGGTGKTPFVLWLAERLKAAGRKPAILTRGYRRRAPERHTVLEPGQPVPVRRTGDEAQIFVRSAVGPVGIGADRVTTGRVIEERFRPDVFLLDDGFQHRRLERDLDIVLVDGLAPFGGGGEPFPLGRLREPLRALARADVFVITRTECGRSYEGIELWLREHNPSAPVFRSRVVPQCWVEPETDRRWGLDEFPFSRVGAFCALANPASFWQTLACAGLRPVARWSFADHHHYRPPELRRLASHARHAGAEALVTTEKDFMNLSDVAAEVVAPLKLLWLKIGMEVDDGGRLLQLIEQRVPSVRQGRR